MTHVKGRKISMAISSAVESGPSIILYNEKGSIIAAIPRGSGQNDGLRGYTASSVSVRSGPAILIYNDKGGLVGSVPA
jgi:thioredoxin-related protein